MARLAADDIVSQGRKVAKLYASPLSRTQQSAEPLAAALKLTPLLEDRIIEPTNMFEGYVPSWGTIFRHPSFIFRVLNPLRPGWGEPYKKVASRMMAAIEAAEASVESGDVILVSHQLPIEMVRRTVAGLWLPHNPRRRRCSLSSITSFQRIQGKWVEIDYREPALKAHAVDNGAA
jgi:broad specificity phosphatase PhoE